MDRTTTLNWKSSWNNDELQASLPFWQRREFILALIVILLGLALYMPRLGSYALWDPWEPHYSQVAMEMNQKGECLTPTYRHSNRWFSKPVMLFWMLKPSFAIFGQTEFAARLPIVLTTILGLILFNFLAGRIFSWRVGFLATLVLATSPQFFFIARQTIFDMPYVVFQTVALLLLVGGLFSEKERPGWIWGFWAVSAIAMLFKGLLAIMLPASIIGTYVLISWDWAILRRMRFGRGLLLFFVIASPWFIYMTAKFGWPYFKSFFIYHHFERAAGLIKKPNNTFDLYIRQIFYATFPWSAFLPFAFVHFLRHKAEDVFGRNRKNLMLFLCFAMPYIMFTLSSTKFNHYIFPTVPFLALIIAHYLEGRARDSQQSSVRFEVIIATLIFVILAKDLVTNYKHLIHLFIYYYDRAMPRGVNPRDVFYALMIPMGLAIGLPMIRRKISWGYIGVLVLLSMSFSLYCNASLMPKLADTFSQKMVWDAYLKEAKNNEPICEYHSWQRRSVSYYADNRTVYLNSRKGNSHKSFFNRKGKLYCMVDRNIYSKLRTRVKTDNGKELYIVNSEHPFTYLVATEPPKNVAVKNRDFVLKKAPAIPKRVKASWDSKIKLLGWGSNKQKYKVNDKVTLTFYFEVLEEMDEDYNIFIHGDIIHGGGRLNGDHPPADGRYPTDRWKKGEIVKDIWEGKIPSNLSTGNMEVYLGFFKGSKRLPVDSGPQDGDDRVKVGSIRIYD